MTATATHQVTALQLNHPTLGCPAVAEVVKKWYENGRFSGYELQFPGEKTTRHLRLKEIWKLQGYDDDDRL